MAKLVKGSISPTLLEYLGKGDWRLRWNIVYIEGSEENSKYYEYIEESFRYMPTLSEIKSVILKWYNSEIDREIVSGFKWEGHMVWLSTENQFNYKADYDLAIQENGSNLPTTFKFGTSEVPIYYTFETLESIKDFYSKSVKYVKDVLKKGWEAKDSFDFSPYAEILG